MGLEEIIVDVNEKPRLWKLFNSYREHKKIIIGVDFDDTLFPLDDRWEKLCQLVRSELRATGSKATICLYTVADNQSIRYKLELMRLWGIPADYVNKSPIKLGNGEKPFFNLLLDDKAGLQESLSLLIEFNKLTEKL